jgi:asparagine synthase (glutamine-hydrolysing)
LRAAAFFRLHIKSTGIEEYLSWRSYATAAQIERLGFPCTEDQTLSDSFSNVSLHTLRDILLTDIRFNLPADMLKKVDLASMQHGLEVRLPFLDSQLVEFALSLPEEYLLAGGVRKYILRETFRGDLPAEILMRGKRGFLLPIRKWMKTGRMRDELLDIAKQQSVLNAAAIESFADEHRDGIIDHSPLLWACYIFLKWRRRERHLAPTKHVNRASAVESGDLIT